MIKNIKIQENAFPEDLMLNVRKPARYMGREFNSVCKPFNDNQINFALCFPDSYEIGMSHLGLKILYHILNRQPDVFCERCFSVWPDMAKVMQENDIELFSLESQRSIRAFDIIGFSLQYELCCTNVLHMLDLANIPLQSNKRHAHPLIIAGGPCTVNPEPMSDFIDLFFVGESEETILNFINLYRELKIKYPIDNDDKRLSRENREKIIYEVAKNIQGVYAPMFYDKKTDENGKPKILPNRKGVPEVVQRSFVKNLDKVDYFTKPPVPYIDAVHDRISLEIMRGCPNKCYFCQAGFTINPVRIRSVDKLLKLAEETYFNTGYDDISFCALSSSNYPHLKDLISNMHSFAKENGMGISLPSLRVDKDFIDVLSLIGNLKKTGLTFAPEAGSQRLRKIINKNIDINLLKEAVLGAYKAGWRKLKLYFMIGLPGETKDDIQSIAHLTEEISLLRKQIDNKRGKISVGVSNFIPKAHTPFQWEAMDTVEVLKEKQRFLRKIISKKYIDVDFHNAEMSFIEALIARGNRDMSKVILKAYELGARFDAWKNEFKFEIWENALEQTGYNLKATIYTKKNIDEFTCWSHISCGFNNDDLKNYTSKLKT